MQIIRKLRTEKPKDYWKLINSINKKTENIPVEINDMFEYFKTLNKNDDYEDATADAATPEIFLNIADFENDEAFNISQSPLNSPIYEREINIAIKALKLNKACGTDGIVNEYYNFY